MHNPGGKQGAHLTPGHRLREPGCSSQAHQTMVISRVWAWKKLGRQRITTGLGSVSVVQGLQWLLGVSSVQADTSRPALTLGQKSSLSLCPQQVRPLGSR